MEHIILNTPHDVYTLLCSQAYVAFKGKAKGQLLHTLEGIEAEIMQCLPPIDSRASNEPLYQPVSSHIELNIGALVEIGFDTKASFKR